MFTAVVHVTGAQASNNWIAIRVRNATHNFQYVEYDPDWVFTEGTPLQHYEFYDIAKDPYQMSNVHDSLDKVIQTALHTEILTYYTCKGSTCPPMQTEKVVV